MDKEKRENYWFNCGLRKGNPRLNIAICRKEKCEYLLDIMNLINLVEQWNNEARRCFARADDENNSVERRIWESKAILLHACAYELNEVLEDGISCGYKKTNKKPLNKGGN